MPNMPLKNYSIFRWIQGVAIVAFFIASPVLVYAEDDLFPVYPSIVDNVKFWEDVYSKYSLSQGVIHDTDDLSKIYEVMDLVPQDENGARKINKERIKQAKGHYKDILLGLAQGNEPRTVDEQKVFDMFGPQVTSRELYEAAKNIRFQLGQKDRFMQGVIRSGAYLAEMKDILRSYGLSEDLAYLPHVESSFNYKAYSKFGAAGVWQFTQSTGKRYMTVNYTLDERRDPIRSTHAAAKLLKRNQEKLDSWPLALTAYNHGATGMQKAKEKYGDYETILNEYNGKTFKFASRNFYSEFIAARNIAKNYEEYFGRLDLQEPRKVCEVELAGYASIQDLARHFQVDLDTLEELNPAIRPPVFLDQKYVPRGCTLLLPADVLENVADLAVFIPVELFKASQKHSQFYRVQRGDTVGEIARRHSIKLRDLLLANNLDSRATIYRGQNLRIPSSDEKIVLLTASKKRIMGDQEILVASLQTKPEESSLISEVVAEAPIVSDMEEPDIEQKYMQASIVPFSFIGDKVLTEIFNSWEPEPQILASLTPVPPQADFLAGINPAVVSGNFDVERVYQSNGKSYGVITVEAEETLGHYADWVGVSASSIRSINGFRYGMAIHVSQRLIIPLEVVSKDEFEEKRYEYHKEMEEDFWVAYRVEGVRTYEIKKGENIWTLCNSEFELPFWLLKKYNSSIDFYRLMPSQRLIIPVIERVG
jgi:membrane-bound lytic murein transglycosylase D